MLEPEFLAATLPLFEGGDVDALEWSFDMGWSTAMPAWADGLLAHYGAEGALYGHGVSMSPLSATWTARQQRWLDRLSVEVAARSYVRVSEHMGFLTTEQFIDGPPLPVPFTQEAVAIGVDRLQRLARTTGVPVGLENLALALSPADVADQGAFLEALLAPVDGFLLLDLHNLWCQAVNYDRDPAELLRTYPLRRVRQLHVSGGKWAHPLGRRFRRDTHDDLVPVEVLELVDQALPLCPQLDLVILERLGGAVGDQAAFQAEYLALRQRVSPDA